MSQAYMPNKTSFLCNCVVGCTVLKWLKIHINWGVLNSSLRDKSKKNTHHWIMESIVIFQFLCKQITTPSANASWYCNLIVHLHRPWKFNISMFCCTLRSQAGSGPAQPKRTPTYLSSFRTQFNKQIIPTCLIKRAIDLLRRLLNSPRGKLRNGVIWVIVVPRDKISPAGKLACEADNLRWEIICLGATKYKPDSWERPTKN